MRLRNPTKGSVRTRTAPGLHAQNDPGIETEAKHVIPFPPEQVGESIRAPRILSNGIITHYDPPQMLPVESTPPPCSNLFNMIPHGLSAADAHAYLLATFEPKGNKQMAVVSEEPTSAAADHQVNPPETCEHVSATLQQWGHHNSCSPNLRQLDPVFPTKAHTDSSLMCHENLSPARKTDLNITRTASEAFPELTQPNTFPRLEVDNHASLRRLNYPSDHSSEYRRSYLYRGHTRKVPFRELNYPSQYWTLTRSVLLTNCQ